VLIFNKLLVILFVVVVPILTYLFRQKTNAPLKKLLIGLKGLEPVNGKSRSAILEVLGPPNRISSIDSNQQFLQWERHGEYGFDKQSYYSITLLFNEHDICQGVTDEQQINIK